MSFFFLFVSPIHDADYTFGYRNIDLNIQSLVDNKIHLKRVLIGNNKDHQSVFLR